jgi:hypothetical protein
LKRPSLVASQEQRAKRVYARRETGRAHARQQTGEPAWNDERIAEFRAAAERGVVLETISLMTRIALTGTDEAKAAAEQILGSANEKLKS